MAELVFSLAWKMLATAAIILIASRVAERAGPLMASVIITLPVNAGPGFFFMALDQSDRFISEGALFAFAAAGAVLVFSAVYVQMARVAGFLGSLAVAMLAWTAVAVLIRWLPLNLAIAFGWYAFGMLVAWLLRRRFDLHGLPGAAAGGFGYLLLRAGLAGLVVAAVATAGGLLGPALAGLALGFPTAMTASIWLLHQLYGREFAAATLASTQRSLAAYAGFCLVLHLLSGPLPALAAFAVALAASVLVAAAIAALAHRGRLRAARLQRGGAAPG